jgi:hypothetical protein
MTGLDWTESDINIEVKQRTYVTNFSSLCAISAEKLRADGYFLVIFLNYAFKKLPETLFGQN